MLFARKDLEEKGYETDTLGLLNGDCGNINWADILLLPVPASRDKININCPLTNRKIPLSIIDDFPDEKLIISGGLSLNRSNFINYLELDSYAVLGAVPTAEGAIHCAIENTEHTLWKSKVLIIGCGRVSRILISRLLSFGCRLTVSARNNRDFAYLDALGIDYIKTDSVSDLCREFDVIFNTIDVPVLDRADITQSNLIIDLSTKGCFTDTPQSIRYIKLPGIPGKIAPATAGTIISETVIQIINGQRR